MKTDTTDKELDVHIMKYKCLMNAFEERHFRNYTFLNYVFEDFTNPSKKQKLILPHLKTETATIDTAIAEREIELIRKYKEAMIAEAVMGKRK